MKSAVVLSSVTLIAASQQIIPMNEEDVPILKGTPIITIDPADVGPLTISERRRRYDFAACRLEANPAVESSQILGKIVLA